MQRIVLFWLVYVLYLCPSWEAHAQAVEIDYASFRADTAYIGSLQRTARSLRHKSTDSGILLYQRALHLSRSMEYIDGMARSLTGLGLFYMDKGDYQKSTTYYQLAEPVCSMSTFKNGFLLANLYNSIAALYGNRGVSDSAIHYYYKALNHIERQQIEDTGLLLLIYSNLGGRLAATNQAERAKFYLEKGISISLRTHNQLMLGKFYKDLGILYGILKQPGVSRNYSFKALKIFKEVDDPPSELATYCNIGLSYLDQGKPQRALDYYRTALSEKVKTSPTQKISALKGIGACYLAMKNFAFAEQYYRQALSIAQEQKVIKSTLESYKALAGVYAGMGDYRKALSFQESFENLKDSTLNAERLEKAERLEVEYRTAQKDKELVQQQLQLQQHQNIIQRKNRLMSFMVIAAALSVALLVVLQRNYKNKRKIEFLELENAREIAQMKAMMAGEEKERERIARELHDGIMAEFSAAQMNLGALIERAGENDITEMEQVLQQLEHATKELRKSAHNLMPDMLLKEGLEAATHYFCKTLERSTGIQILFQMVGTMERIAPHYELMFYRILQELLHNVTKHAHAQQVLVQINSYPHLFSIVVEDDGVGLSAHSGTPGTGFGLSGIKSRIESLHGYVQIHSQPRGGTSVYIEVETKNLKPGYATKKVN
jgi:signal transduction histidine kinase